MTSSACFEASLAVRLNAAPAGLALCCNSVISSAPSCYNGCNMFEVFQPEDMGEALAHGAWRQPSLRYVCFTSAFCDGETEHALCRYLAEGFGGEGRSQRRIHPAGAGVE